MEGLRMKKMQQLIIEAMKTKPVIDAVDEINQRVSLLKQYLLYTKMKGFVLGISGGQDSTLAGKLAQMAIDELNKEDTLNEYNFFTVRLPYGEQFDEVDAQDALNFIQPSKRLTVNIKEAVDASYQAFSVATGEEMSDFVKGNTKARERMKVQYDIAAHYQCLVIGTDHSAEAITGFFTKHGDGACDIVPLYGLNKRQGKQLLQQLGCPEHLYKKTPTADLEDDKPGLPDEVALGFTYEQIDDYLEGKEVAEEIKTKIELKYKVTEHKRQSAVNLYTNWWQENE